MEIEVVQCDFAVKVDRIAEAATDGSHVSLGGGTGQTWADTIRQKKEQGHFETIEWLCPQKGRQR